jgi:hypothetical protein
MKNTSTTNQVGGAREAYVGVEKCIHSLVGKPEGKTTWKAVM